MHHASHPPSAGGESFPASRFSIDMWQKLFEQTCTLTPDRIRANYLGLAIGDALGLPVETLTPKEIVERFGRVTTYISNPTHPWYASSKAGTWSDDTQLSLAVQEALAGSGFSIDALKQAHTKAARESTLGWGQSTRLAVERFADPDYKAGETAMGTGNGVIMKLSPLVIWMRSNARAEQIPAMLDAFTDLTHPAPVARTATRAFAAALLQLTNMTPGTFDAQIFVENVISAAREHATDRASRELVNRLEELENYANLSIGETVERWGGGGCYVLHSLPVTLLIFLKNPHSFDALIDAANAGGDTDSNASMVGAMLGMLHGTKILPPELIKGLDRLERIEKAAA